MTAVRSVAAIASSIIITKLLVSVGGRPLVEYFLRGRHRREDEGPAGIESEMTRPTGKGPAETFTGTVMVDPLMGARPQTRVGAGHVTFEPGARSAWHTHPARRCHNVHRGSQESGWQDVQQVVANLAVRSEIQA
jgi:hypothetical protein